MTTSPKPTGQVQVAARMDPEVKARWVAALRSGEYKQIKGALKREGGHCCLGVLCDLYAKERGLKRWNDGQLSADADRTHSIHFQDKGIPGAVVGIWSGFDSSLRVSIGKKTQQLDGHNDDGCTFDEIADAIEAQL